MKQNLVVVGYVLLVVGFLSIILGMVGINLSYLAWLENFGRLPAFIVKLAFVVFGLIIMYVAKTNNEQV